MEKQLLNWALPRERRALRHLLQPPKNHWHDRPKDHSGGLHVHLALDGARLDSNPEG